MNQPSVFFSLFGENMRLARPDVAFQLISLAADVFPVAGSLSSVVSYPIERRRVDMAVPSIRLVLDGPVGSFMASTLGRTGG